MKNEIKEILEYMKKIANKNEEDFESELSHRDCALLLDYITNLQEELKSANESITWWTDRFKAVEKENERLKQDYINVKNYILLRKVNSEVQDKALLYNIELENINKKRYEDYKSRCEKALELVEQNLMGIGYVEASELFNILQGEDKE